MLWSTTFSTGSLEEEYQAELVPEKIRLMRMTAVLGIALNLSFVVLDVWAIPSALAEVWTLRASMIVALLVIGASTWRPLFPRRYTAVVLATFTILGAGVTGILSLAGPGEVAIEQYHGGVLLLIMGVHTLTYVAPALALAMSLVLLFTYAAICALAHGYVAGAELVILIANLFTGVSTAVIGVVAQSLRDRYSRENYLLRHSLQRDVEIKDEERQRASFLAEHDSLTGLANRMRFEREAGAMIDQAARDGSRVVVMFIDLDDFKPVNDSHGHDAGDRVLRTVAERLQARLRNHDICARLGGDEFVVAMVAARDDARAIRTSAARLTRAIQDDIDVRGARLRLTASIGIAVYPEDGADLATVVRAADERMYDIKHHGKAGIAMTPACEADPTVADDAASR